MSDFQLQPQTPHPVFYDADFVTSDPWPLPEVRAWAPVAKPSLWARIVAWLDEAMGMEIQK